MKVRTRKYVDGKFKGLKEWARINFKLDRKAVDQYSKTNDEWKTMHNGLQRKMEEDRSKYVTKEELNKQTRLILAVVTLLVTIYEVFLKKVIS